MASPVLVEVTRGPLVESRHRASVVVALPGGETVLTLGEAGAPVFPRSAIKAFQALPLMAAGGAEEFGFTGEEIALMCASHNGEPAHVSTARGILAKAGFSEHDLECGAHWPQLDNGYVLAAEGRRPTPIHSNCSGKHGGMLALARLLGVGGRGYVDRGHAVQERIAGAVGTVCGEIVAEAPCAVDGCSAPTWGVPLASLATGFARFANGEGLPRDFAAASAQIRAAVAAAPFMVAGSNRFCTGVMQVTGARAFVKTGAEGVMCAALPERNLGIAVKCEDGAARAAEVIMAHLLAAFGAADGEAPAFAHFLTPPLRNWAGIHVGEVRAAPALSEALCGAREAMLA